MGSWSGLLQGSSGFDSKTVVVSSPLAMGIQKTTKTVRVHQRLSRTSQEKRLMDIVAAGAKTGWDEVSVARIPRIFCSFEVKYFNCHQDPATPGTARMQGASLFHGIFLHRVGFVHPVACSKGG
eukprot:6460676-Amphidinium_carterae.2